MLKNHSDQSDYFKINGVLESTTTPLIRCKFECDLTNFEANVYPKSNQFEKQLTANGIIVTCFLRKDGGMNRFGFRFMSENEDINKTVKLRLVTFKALTPDGRELLMNATSHREDLFIGRASQEIHTSLDVTTAIRMVGRKVVICADLQFYEPEKKYVVDGLEMEVEIQNQFDVDENADFVIATGEKKWKVHTFILRMKSSLFKAMLKNTCIETVNNKLTITEFSEEAVEIALRFLYHFNMTKLQLEKHGEELFCFSIKYDVTSLNRVMVDYIVNNTTIENAISWMWMGENLNCQEVKKKSFEIIAKNFDRFFGASNNEKMLELFDKNKILLFELLAFAAVHAKK